MAVWKLSQPHYLNILDETGEHTKYEHKEQLQGAKKATRVMFNVPCLLDPRDASDHNFQGMILVRHGESRMYPMAHEFRGPPTPDMDPMDEEAEKITEATRPTWSNPIENIGDGGYAAGIEAMFARQLGELVNKLGVPTGPIPVPEGSVSKAEFDDLKAQNALMMEQLATLMAQQVEQPGARR